MFCDTIDDFKAIPSASNLLFSKNEDEVVVVVLDDVPVTLSRWSSSDEKSKLFARGTEWESSDEALVSTSWAFMELMIDVVERADGDGDFFEIFSKVLTK